jgi:HCOMODA/2-hydroxy-3-carboxy-muconic semialdehyde decarboxylase
MNIRVIAYIAATATVVALLVAQRVTGQEARTAVAGAGQQLIDDLVVGNRILANENVLDGLGHISVRHHQNPNRFLLARDVAPALVTAADLIEYDLDGNPVSDKRQGYQERYIHSAIYKARPDVQSIVHAHTPSVLAFAISNIPLRPIYHMAAFLAGGVPNYEIRKVQGSTGMLVNNNTLGDALAQTLGDKPVALMRGHGVVIVGPNIPEAVSRSIFLDVNARVQIQAMSLGGTVSFLGGQDIAPPAQTPGQQGPPATGGVSRSWLVWKQRAMGQ